MAASFTLGFEVSPFETAINTFAFEHGQATHRANKFLSNINRLLDQAGFECVVCSHWKSAKVCSKQPVCRLKKLFC